MKVSLVLGSGGARGYAHIGAIEELLKRGHEIVAISGASMGALVGGAYAADSLDQLVATFKSLSRSDMWRLARPMMSTSGIIKLDRTMALLESVIGDVRIEDLSIPLSIVATDLVARREIWFKKGPLLSAIRASISIPAVFPPVMLNGRVLVDGGLVNPLPLENSLRMDADVTVAVSLFGRQHKHEFGGAKNTTSDQEASAGPVPLNRLASLLAGTLPTRTRANAPLSEFERLPKNLDLLRMMMMSLDAMQERIQASRLAVNPPDIHIEVPAESATIFNFDEADRIIELGRDLAIAKFDEAGI